MVMSLVSAAAISTCAAFSAITPLSVFPFAVIVMMVMPVVVPVSMWALRIDAIIIFVLERVDKSCDEDRDDFFVGRSLLSDFLKHVSELLNAVEKVLADLNSMGRSLCHKVREVMINTSTV